MRAKTGICILLALVMTCGLLPAPALAEVRDEATTTHELQSQSDDLDQAARTMASQLTGTSMADKAAALYGALATTPLAEDHTPNDEDGAILSALRGEASTPDAIARAYVLVATELGIPTFRVIGADGSSWCMVETDDGWRHVNPAKATGADDDTWLLLTDSQVLEKDPDVRSWTLEDGSEAPSAEDVAHERLGEDEAAGTEDAAQAPLPEDGLLDEDEAAVTEDAAQEPLPEDGLPDERAADADQLSLVDGAHRTQDADKGLSAQSDDPATPIDISKADVQIPDQPYTGKALEPDPVVTLAGATLTRGTDYDATYANNTKAGTAQVTIRGKGAYTGTARGTFKIVAPSISYRVHVQSIGDQDAKKDGATAGTSGMSKRLEAIWIDLGSNFPVSGGIEYSTHVQTYGWQKWVQQGERSGTTGEAKRLEAIRLRLTGDMAKHYSVYYRVHAQCVGWMAWAKDGEVAGTSGQSWRLEAIQIKLVPKEAAAPSAEGSATRLTHLTNPGVTYHAHAQTYGWMDWVENGALSGTQGESKRLEALELKLGSEAVPGGIEYRTHVQTYGWQAFVADGATAGTSGESKRLEAFEIRLTGEASKYFDVWYRAHVQTFGWLGWAKNGERAGTASMSKRMEAVQIELLPKGGAAPGSVQDHFIVAYPMTNSPLVVYTAYSPNHSGRRNHTIDTITPHYMGGNGTVEACGAVFAPVSRQASSNYGIGSDGRIALYVDEANRAWTSGSSANDNRAVTIEAANLADGSLTNACWSSLVRLCADICQRNGKTRLVYLGSPDYTSLGPSDMLLTMHKWFQATDCPGPWLSYQFDRLASEVNAILNAG